MGAVDALFKLTQILVSFLLRCFVEHPIWTAHGRRSETRLAGIVTPSRFQPSFIVQGDVVWVAPFNRIDNMLREPLFCRFLLLTGAATCHNRRKFACLVASLQRIGIIDVR